MRTWTARWWRSLFGDAAARPPAPVLLRVADPCGAAPGRVTVAATWKPSGRVIEREHRTAAGLCVIPWLGEEREVELEVRTSAGERALSIRRDRPDDGRVRDLRLAPSRISPLGTAPRARSRSADRAVGTGS